MAVQHNSLFVSRTMLQAEHAGLLGHMRDFNHDMPHITLQWRRLGEVGVMLVQSGEYKDLLRQPRSRLASQRPSAVVKKLNEEKLAGMERQSVALGAAAFLGHNTDTYVHVGYPIDPDELLTDREMLIGTLNDLNRTVGEWQFAFAPYLSIATLNRMQMNDTVLEAFNGINPGSATLHPPRAHAA